MNNEKIELKNGKLAGAIFSVFAFSYIIIAVLGGSLVQGLGENSALRYAISAFFSPLALLVVVMFFKIYKKEERVYLGVHKTSVQNVLLGVLLFLAMFLGLSTLNVKFVEFLESYGIKTSSISVSMNGFFDYALLVLTLAVFPAVFEELLFRGLILNHTIGNKKWATYIMVGFLFALFHGSLSQLIYQFVYGVLLCALADKSESVLPAILAHFLNNFVVLTAEYVGFNLSAVISNPFVIISGLILLAGFVFIIVYKGKKHNTPSDVSGLFLPYGIFGALVFVMLIILGA